MLIDRADFEKICQKIDWSTATPAKENVLNALTSPHAFKVVILGQDPYPAPGVANGFAFAVNKDVAIPASLKQIFKEITNEFGQVKTDRTLQSWVEQGVLLLNTALTTEMHNPGSHHHIWQQFTTRIIQHLGQNPNLIWILWGNEAKKYKQYIKSLRVIEDAHPSPLSRPYRRETTFGIIKKYVDIDW